MERKENRTHRKRVPKKFGTRFCFNKACRVDKENLHLGH